MKNVTFRLTDDEITRVDEHAEADKRSRSQMLRVLVTEALDARDSRFGLATLLGSERDER
jgi:predicted transcriptional regulator